jgi:quercetin dioxygenase-like cupin family protein
VTTARPQVIDTRALATQAQGLGAQWSLSGERELEANLVHIPTDGVIADHVSGVDVAMVGIAGEGSVTVDNEAIGLRDGLLVFVPRGLVRSVRAGGSGLTYLTLHRRRDEGLTVGKTRTGGSED